MKPSVLRLLFLLMFLLGLLNGSAQAAKGKVSSLKGKALFIPGEVLVKFKDGAAAADKAKIMSVGQSKMTQLSNLVKIKLAPDQDVLQTVEDLKRNSAVSYAQPNYIYHALGACSVPSDYYYFNSLHNYSWPLTIIQADKAWTLLNWPSCPPGSSSVTLAVLDTGLSRQHPDFKANPAVPFIGYNAVGDSGEESDTGDGCSYPGSNFENVNNSTTTDDFGHGTYVTGIIAAQWNLPQSESCPSVVSGITGMAGLAPGITVMVVKVLDCQGSGTSDMIALGINYAVGHGAKIISMSLGGPADPTEESAIEAAIASGCIVVAAAGNESDLPGSLAQLDYPAGYPGVVAVGATDSTDHVAFYSNGGEGLNGKILDLVAPGGGAIQTFPGNADVDAAYDVFSAFVCPETAGASADGGFETASDSNFGVASGTSAATPYVSATAALLWSLYPSLTNTQVIQQIVNNTDSINGNKGWDAQTGYGRLNVYKALSAGIGSGEINTYVKTFNSPNPFYVDVEQYTNITLVLNQPEPVDLTIYDTGGEVVLHKSYDAAQLNNNPSNPQFQSYYVAWDGKNGSGQKVKTGVYFYTVKTNGQVGHNKIAVIQGQK